MNNNRFSLGYLRNEVFRVLDEYTSNGIAHEIFTGGTGDIEKRFISALNSAIRLVYLSAARTPKKKRILLEKPTVSSYSEDFRIYPGEDCRSFELADTGAGNTDSFCLSFDFCGEGKLVITGNDGESLESIELSADFGEIGNFKRNITVKNACSVDFCSDGRTLDIKNLIFFGSDGELCGIEDELLPDGKNIYCKISDRFYELKGVFCEKNGFVVEMPEDIFEIQNGILSCEQKYAGEYFVEFFEYPEQIDEGAGIDCPVDIPSAYTDAIIYATAASLCAREDAELYSRLTYKYREYLANLYPTVNLRRKNTFFSGAFFGKRRKIKDFRR